MSKLTKEQRASKDAAFDCIRDEVDELPEDFSAWTHRFYDKLMFYHKNAKNDYTGHCTCGASVPMKSARNGMRLVCPECGNTVRLRADTCYPHVNIGHRVFAYLQRTTCGWMQRLFVIWKSVDYDATRYAINENYYVSEDERDHLDTDGRYWEFHPKQTSGQWTLGCGKKHGESWTGWRAQNMLMHTYPSNLENLFCDSKYKFSQLPTATQNSHVNPFYYLSDYEKYPRQLELLYKAGLYRLGEQLLGYSDGEFWDNSLAQNISKATLKELGIDKRDDLAIAVRLNLGYHALRAYKRIRQEWHIPIAYADIKDAISFMSVVNEISGEDFEYTFIKNERLFKYWLTQKDDYTAHNFFADYRDYVSAILELKLNVRDTALNMPHKLKAAHDWANDLIKTRENKIYETGIAAMYDKFHEAVEWTDGKMRVVVAKNCNEIIREGREQNHCVGRYSERVALGQSIICFIRQNNAPQKAFYTLEIRPDMRKLNIAQCRGHSNKDQTPQVREFLKKYERWFNSRPADGFTDDQIIAKYYKAVRKLPDGRYISDWDNKTEYRIGEIITAELNTDPDAVAVKGLHIASLEFAQKYGEGWPNGVIIEVEVNLNDVVVPDAKDQLRTSRFKVLREVPMSEMGKWGARHMQKPNKSEDAA